MSQPSFRPAPPGPYGAPQFQPPSYPQPGSPGYPLPGPPQTVTPLPVPTQGPPPVPSVRYLAPPLALQRPAVIAMSAAMTVTASLQWICVLSFAWLVATAGAANLALEGREGSLYHLLHRFDIGMADGLAIPMYGIPLLSFFAGFAVLAPRPWTRWLLTGTGLLALGWSAWWLQDQLIWWLAPAFYILIACLILWTPGASRWYSQRGRVDASRPF